MTPFFPPQRPESPRCAYLAGPYSASMQWSVLHNVLSATLAASKLMIEKRWFALVPHTSHHPDLTWEQAMERCKEQIDSLDPKHDVLVPLKGWENSKGAVQERDWAIARGIRVLTLEEAMKETPSNV